MVLLLVILFAVVCLAYANGANDNFKGVATLFGSDTTTYRGALGWATLTTFLGSLTAIFLAEKLLHSFSGRGLVADSLATTPHYVAAVALGAGFTVLIATRIGMPVSTTHSLVGGLVGAGWAADSPINLSKFFSDFFTPLLVSPLIAIVLTGLCYLLFRFFRERSGITKETCFCIGHEEIEIVSAISPAAALERVQHLTVRMGDAVTCRSRYSGRVLGIEAAPILDRLHYISAGVVCFARGLNDTPKIAALLLLIPHLTAFSGTTIVGIAIAVGGALSAKKVAHLMSKNITAMNHGQAFTGNLVTGLVVIGASKMGVPVSTTHVSCGALFGIGTITRQAQWGTILKIVVAWITTLPAAGLLSAVGYVAVSWL